MHSLNKAVDQPSPPALHCLQPRSLAEVRALLLEWTKLLWETTNLEAETGRIVRHDQTGRVVKQRLLKHLKHLKHQHHATESIGRLDFLCCILHMMLKLHSSSFIIIPRHYSMIFHAIIVIHQFTMPQDFTQCLRYPLGILAYLGLDPPEESS